MAGSRYVDVLGHDWRARARHDLARGSHRRGRGRVDADDVDLVAFEETGPGGTHAWLCDEMPELASVARQMRRRCGEGAGYVDRVGAGTKSAVRTLNQAVGSSSP
jgi:hypothetical protein